MNEWRLPTRDELLKACEDKVDGFGSNYYWSSTAVKSHSCDAWYVYFYIGYDFWLTKFNDRYVRLVRGDKLEWSKDIEYMNWYEAQDYVKKINAKGRLDV